MKLRIGSRKSPLALFQTQRVADLLKEAHAFVDVEIVTMDTMGDRIRDVPLPKIGSKGLFTQDLEKALLAGEVDLAVHSLKDLPSRLPEGFCYAGSPQRASPTDALISLQWSSLEAIPSGGTIATGSTRRRAQLLYRRPDLQFVDLRGNIDTRLRKLDANGWDAIVMATAALQRLQRGDLVSQELSPERFVPAVSQGAIGIEITEDRSDIKELIQPICHAETVEAVKAERTFMRVFEGGCSVPIAAYCHRAHLQENNPDPSPGWTFHAWVGAPDGSKALHEVRSGSNPVDLGEALAAEFVNRGAREMIKP